jgi:hypothetical protein
MRDVVNNKNIGKGVKKVLIHSSTLKTKNPAVNVKLTKTTFNSSEKCVCICVCVEGYSVVYMINFGLGFGYYYLEPEFRLI